MKNVAVGSGKFAIVDDVDYELVSKFTWRLSVPHRSNKQYVQSRIYANGSEKCVLIHRLILGVNDPAVFVDHKDLDTLNNSRSNLRACSNSQNQGNRTANPSKKHTSFKGVYYRPSKKAWIASIKKNGKAHYLGYFKSEETAAIAYNNKARELFGDFALLNKVSGHSEIETTLLLAS